MDEFEKSQTGQPGAEIILRFMRASVTPDASSASGLSDFAHARDIAAMTAVAEELDRAIVQREVDVDFLWTVLSAGYGARIVGEDMLAPLMAMLGERQT